LFYAKLTLCVFKSIKPIHGIRMFFERFATFCFVLMHDPSHTSNPLLIFLKTVRHQGCQIGINEDGV